MILAMLLGAAIGAVGNERLDRVFGDMSGNGIVDLGDWGAVYHCLGAIWWEDEYRCEAATTQGYVDLRDMAMFQRRFDPDPPFAATHAHTAWTYAGPFSLIQGDWDRDGDIDLATVIVEQSYGELRSYFRFLWNDNGEWRVEHVSSAGDVRHMAAVDLEGDGTTEFVLVTFSSAVEVLRRTERGWRIDFGESMQIYYGDKTSWVCALDADGDGDQDVLVGVSSYADLGEAVCNGAVSLLVNDGGRLQWDKYHPLKLYTANGVYAIVTADFDGDGDMDTAATEYCQQHSCDPAEATHDVLIFQNDAGNLALTSRVTVGDVPMGMAMADFDGDGRPDLVVGFGCSDDVCILRNGVSGWDTRCYATSGIRTTLATGDVNGDGAADVVASHQSWDAGTDVLINDGRGEMRLDAKLPATGSRSPVVFDWDGDGDGDIVDCDFFGGQIVWWENRGAR